MLETLGKMNCILRSLSCETQCFHAVFSHVQITNNMCVFCFSWLDPHLPVFVPMYIDIYISHQLHFRVLSFFDLRRL